MAVQYRDFAENGLLLFKVLRQFGADSRLAVCSDWVVVMNGLRLVLGQL